MSVPSTLTPAQAKPSNASASSFPFPSIRSKRNVYINALVYGAPGVGKTVFAGTGPKPVVYFDCDQGTLSVREMEDVYHQEIKKQEDITKGLALAKQTLEAKPGSIGTVVLDNLTELQRVLMAEMMQNRSQNAIPEIKDWGVILLKVQSIVRHVKALPCHTIFIAHEASRDGNYSASLSGKISEELPGYFDEVFRYVLSERVEKVGDKEEVKIIRALLCRPMGTSMAKDRSGKLNRYEQPDLTKIIEKILAPTAASTQAP